MLINLGAAISQVSIRCHEYARVQKLLEDTRVKEDSHVPSYETLRPLYISIPHSFFLNLQKRIQKSHEPRASMERLSGEIRVSRVQSVKWQIARQLKTIVFTIFPFRKPRIQFKKEKFFRLNCHFRYFLAWSDLPHPVLISISLSYLQRDSHCSSESLSPTWNLFLSLFCTSGSFLSLSFLQLKSVSLKLEKIT